MRAFPARGFLVYQIVGLPSKVVKRNALLAGGKIIDALFEIAENLRRKGRNMWRFDRTGKRFPTFVVLIGHARNLSPEQVDTSTFIQSIEQRNLRL